MPINFKTYSDLWIKAVNDKETQGLPQVFSDDFVWSNERFKFVASKQEIIDVSTQGPLLISKLTNRLNKIISENPGHKQYFNHLKQHK